MAVTDQFTDVIQVPVSIIHSHGCCVRIRPHLPPTPSGCQAHHHLAHHHRFICLQPHVLPAASAQCCTSSDPPGHHPPPPTFSQPGPPIMAAITSWGGAHCPTSACSTAVCADDVGPRFTLTPGALSSIHLSLSLSLSLRSTHHPCRCCCCRLPACQSESPPVADLAPGSNPTHHGELVSSLSMLSSLFVSHALMPVPWPSSPSIDGSHSQRSSIMAVDEALSIARLRTMRIVLSMTSSV